MAKKFLEDREYLFTLLMAIVKRDGGTLRLSEEDLMKVVKGESMSLAYDKATREIILKCVETEMDLYTALKNMSPNREDDEYEN